MTYVKITDPNIIDLAAWHQLINVVNQQGDKLDALTNSYGLGWNPITDTDNSWKTLFDLGTQTIQYGRNKMIESEELATINGAVIYDETITYQNEFSSVPNVVATISKTGSNTSTNIHASDLILILTDIGTNSFNARVRKSDGTATDATQWYINWIAIGPQA